VSTWPAQSTDTLRLDAIGDVARPFELCELSRSMIPLALGVTLKRVSPLSLLAPLARSLMFGRRPRRGELVMHRAGDVINAFVVLVTIDVCDPETRRRAHEVVRRLELPAIDAIEDMLAHLPAVRPILEAERLYRAGLAGDWTLVAGTVTDGRRIALVVSEAIRSSISA